MQHYSTCSDDGVSTLTSPSSSLTCTVTPKGTFPGGYNAHLSNASETLPLKHCLFETLSSTNTQKIYVPNYIKFMLIVGQSSKNKNSNLS